MRIPILLFICLLINACNTLQDVEKTSIQKNGKAYSLIVDGTPFFIQGMNWDYYPIGTDYSYSLWDKNEDFIKQALRKEMLSLKDLGVNAIRHYTGIPAKWIAYIYHEYGIYTMLNHPFGRYGVNIDGQWISKTDYSNPQVKNQLLKEVRAMAESYKNTPGLLLYLLGNENNYGLVWEGAETEDIPDSESSFLSQARFLYQLFNEAAIQVKEIDMNHPVAICNGDLQYLDIIADLCTDIDVFGTNMYRGRSFEDAFQRVNEVIDLPIIVTEFGADAYHSLLNIEDESAQAQYIVENWKEIYAQSAGLGEFGNSLGGFTFQFSDGWWKHGQTKNLNSHDINASWVNEGYKHDFTEGENNMNEEWFGICAKGPTDSTGHYELHPRAAYFALQQIHSIELTTKGFTLVDLEEHFSKISISDIIQKHNNESELDSNDLE